MSAEVVQLDTRPTNTARFYALSLSDRQRQTKLTLDRITATMAILDPWSQQEVDELIENLILLRMYDPSQSSIIEPTVISTLAKHLSVSPIIARRQFEETCRAYNHESAKKSGLNEEIADTLAYFRRHGILYTGKKTTQIFFTDKGKDDWVSPDVLRIRYGHLNILVPDSKRKINIVDYACTENIFRKAYKIVFDPSNKERYIYSQEYGEWCYNTWRGWPYAQTAPLSHEVAKSRIPLFLEHAMIMCNHDQAVFNHMMGMMAHMVQRPAKKMGVSIALLGEMGAGKDVLFKLFGKIFHPDHATVMGQSIFSGRFTSALESKLLVHMAEMQFKRADTYDKLKDLITNEKTRLESKGIDDREEVIHANFVITTNHADAFPVTDRERRLFVIEVSDENSIDPLKDPSEEAIRITTKFNALFEQMDANIPALYWFFNTYDLTGFIPSQYPRTDARAEMIIKTKTGVARWGSEVLQSGIFKTETPMLTIEWPLDSSIEVMIDEINSGINLICKEDRVMGNSSIIDIMAALYLPPKPKGAGVERFSGPHYKRKANGKTFLRLPPRQWCIDRSPLKGKI